jgi:hypothetical protein
MTDATERRTCVACGTEFATSPGEREFFLSRYDSNGRPLAIAYEPATKPWPAGADSGRDASRRIHQMFRQLRHSNHRSAVGPEDSCS